ncbi:MAG TPA: tripartite tricarboxylate transporter substrate binding protein [Xanthobacteraceae bacterium]|nr:tripartite tricarboxylate transporter substrate binding protein [Xanthobacteraceae bacterium]
MNLPRRKFLRLAGAAATLPILARPAIAQTYPTRPLRWIVPYPAGGATDLIARLIGQWLQERLGQPVIVDNRPGGGTNIGTQAAVGAAPDGYTLLFTASTHTINASLQQLPFNFLRDITMVSGLAELPLVMNVGPKFPAKTLAEFVAYAKANPGKVNVASFGATTISHLAIEFFKVTTGADVVHVPYRGGAQIMADLISGQIDAAVDSLPSSLPHIKRNAIRALAVLSAERSPVLPDLPAANEIIPGLEVRTFSGVGAPSGTPREIVDRLNKEINAGLADPTIKARFADAGASPAIVTSAEANAFVRAQTEKWAKVIKEAGIKPE